MKTRLISLFALLLFLSVASYSQSLTVGIKGGVSINKITGKSFKEQFTYGYHIGGYATIGLGKKFAFQPEVLFNQINTDTSSQFSSIYSSFNHINNIKLGYLSIPLILNYNVSTLLALQVGPQFGVLINQNKNLLQNGSNAFKSGDFAMLGGLQLKLLKFRLYGRYVIGLNNLDNIGNKDNWKSQSIQLGLGINL